MSILVVLMLFLGFKTAWGGQSQSITFGENHKVLLMYENDKAKEVILAGSLLDRDWQKREALNKAGKKFSLELKLLPGEYQYKFIVDGVWTLDPLNDKQKNGNSLLYVPGLFEIEGPAQILLRSPSSFRAIDINEKGEKIENTQVKWSVNQKDFQWIDGQLIYQGQEAKLKNTQVILTAEDKNGVQVSKTLQIVEEITEAEGGRNVIVAGTLQTLFSGAKAWDPGDQSTRMLYRGEGLYELKIPQMPPGTYEYKIAMGSWNENYGDKGLANGPNIKLTLREKQDVSILYSDKSHRATDSTKYSLSMFGKKIPLYLNQESFYLVDNELNGIFKGEIDLAPGLYKGGYILFEDQGKAEKKLLGDIAILADKKLIVGFDQLTQMIFNNQTEEKIEAKGIYYNSKDLAYKRPFGAVMANHPIQFTIDTFKGAVSEVKLVVRWDNQVKLYDMSKKAEQGDKDKWQCSFSLEEIGTYQYYFILTNGSDVKVYSDDDGYWGEGTLTELSELKPYGLNIYREDYKTPDWMKQGVVYQIFPDRFLNGNWSNDQAETIGRNQLTYEFYNQWYSIPENPAIMNQANYKGTKGDGQWGNEIYGGDLEGIIQRLDYLKSLGVNVLYLNPIHKSVSNHRYDASDYGKVDPILGTIENFEQLAKELEKRDMRLVLDGVFNHVSDDSIYFDRYKKNIQAGSPIGAYPYWEKVYQIMAEKQVNQTNAEKIARAEFVSQGITDFRYVDWFKIQKEKVEGVHLYEGWWGYDHMPVIQSLNGSESNIDSWRQEIIERDQSIAKYWLQKGSQGWRLDVANEMSDQTWEIFRKEVKAAGDYAIIGEIWNDASCYLLGNMYDSVMNYRFREAVINYVRSVDDEGNNYDADRLVKELELIRESYPEEAFYAMLNLVDSHDTQRALSFFDGYKKSEKATAEEATAMAKEKMKLLAMIQMTYPGAPCIYYGDEVGMVGADDPDNRRGMLWGKGDKAFVEWYAQLVHIRLSNPVLALGTVEKAKGIGDLFIMNRKYGEEVAVTVVNTGKAKVGYKLYTEGLLENGQLTDAISGKVYQIKQGILLADIPEKGGLILMNAYHEPQIDYKALAPAYDKAYVEAESLEGKTRPKEKTGLTAYKGWLIATGLLILSGGGIYWIKKSRS